MCRPLAVAGTLVHLVSVPRPPRDNAPGIFHAIGRSVTSRALFYDNAARRTFLGLMNGTYERYSFSVVAYCLLSTHVHLIVETTEPDFSRSMQWLNSRFAEAINAEEGGHGHLFGSRFSSKRIESDEHLLGAVRYIARNPVEAGICRAPEDWPWNSYAVLVHGMRRPSFLHPGRVLRMFGPDRDAALLRMQAFVEQGVKVAAVPDPFGDVWGQTPALAETVSRR